MIHHEGLGDEIHRGLEESGQVQDVQKGAGKLEKFESEKIPLPVEEAVDKLLYLPFEGTQEEDQDQHERALQQQRVGLEFFGQDIANVLDEEYVNHQDQSRQEGIQNPAPDDKVNIHEAVFDDGQGEEKADQQGIQAGHEEERIAQVEEIVGQVQDQADDEHGDDPHQKIEDLQPLAGDLGLAVGDDEVDHPPGKVAQADQTQDSRPGHEIPGAP